MPTEPEVLDGEVVEEDEVRHLPAVQAHEALVAKHEISVAEVVEQGEKIKQIMDAVMKEGIHYGKVPGVSKPTLLKPGAELLNVTFRFAPSYEQERVLAGEHLSVFSKCKLTHIPTGLIMAEGDGLCSTFESKYRYRQGKRKCPDCGAEAIVRSGRKNAYFCISAEGGCGNRYAFGTEKATEIDGQDVGRVENPDLPDQWNTVVKMADKRALVAAVLNGTAASDVFTQDVEDQGRGASSGAPFSRENDGGGTETASTPREFDPSADLLPDAPRGEGFKTTILAQLDWMRGDLDWPATIADLPGERDTAFYKRLANATAWLMNVTEGKDFPPLDDAKVMEGFAWAFQGHLLELKPKPEQEPPEVTTKNLPADGLAADDIPFGE